MCMCGVRVCTCARLHASECGCVGLRACVCRGARVRACLRAKCACVCTSVGMWAREHGYVGVFPRGRHSACRVCNNARL